MVKKKILWRLKCPNKMTHFLRRFVFTEFELRPKYRGGGNDLELSECRGQKGIAQGQQVTESAAQGYVIRDGDGVLYGSVWLSG